MNDHYPFHVKPRERGRGDYYMGAIASDHTRRLLAEKARRERNRKLFGRLITWIAILAAAGAMYWIHR